MSRYELYDGLPPHNDTDTSIAAAISVLEDAETMQGRVYRRIRQTGEYGATCDELEIRLNMRHTTCSARIRELVLKGIIKDSGQRRKGSSGRDQRVYVTFSTDVNPARMALRGLKAL